MYCRKFFFLLHRTILPHGQAKYDGSLREGHIVTVLRLALHKQARSASVFSAEHRCRQSIGRRPVSFVGQKGNDSCCEIC